MELSKSPPLAAVQAQLREVREVLAHFHHITLALLFGSVTTGHARSDSDLNIAVSAPSPLGITRQVALTQALAEKTGRPVDMATAPEPLLGQIAPNGQCILGGDNSYARLIQRHLIEKADFMPYKSQVLAEKRMAWISK